MDRRNFLAALIGTPALAALAAACGDDGALRGNPDDVAPDTTVPNDTTVPARTYVHATGADDVVVRIGYEGGFVAPDTIFVNTPNLLVSGDGGVVQPGIIPAIFPGPLLPALSERIIDEVGIQAILREADDAGLLAPPPDYEMGGEMMVADAADTVVTITVDGMTYVHRAYVLDIPRPDGMADTPARTSLAKFVTAMSDLTGVAGAEHLGPDAPLEADQYRFRATVVDPTQWTDPVPTLQPWPASTGIALADSTTCAVADAAAVGDTFTDADQMTFFTEPDPTGVPLTYQIAAIAVLPGDQPC